uniref:Putative tick transposon n=1 Tax=Ixodes ricinus TaxID=34613 RepID=A0A6B0UT91_IXORI
MSYGKSHVGQTGRCINERAREHAWSVKQSPSGNLAVHCDRCPCGPELEKTIVLGRYANKTALEIHEALRIREQGESLCIGAPSLRLVDGGFFFLGRHPDRRCWWSVFVSVGLRLWVRFVSVPFFVLVCLALSIQ